MTPPIRVLLADDHTLFREGLAALIAAQPDFELVGQADDGLEALVKARQLVPDLILMDITMPGGDGLEAARLIKQELPQTVIVMLTVQSEEDKLFQAIQNGAQGYLLKSIHSREMLELLRGAMHGEAAITPALAGRMLEEFRRLSRLPTPPPTDEALTCREQEVLSLVAVGDTNKEIAAALSISLHTVKSHIRSVLAKLQASSRHEAIQQARRRGLV
jgi:two-component system NarL family response regulator